MAEIKVEIKNMGQIRAAFLAAPALMTKNLNLAIRKSIFQIRGQAQKNTPVLTGRLRGSAYNTFAPLMGEVGFKANYAGFVHFGTRFMRARPFLLNAVVSEDAQVQQWFKEAVEDTMLGITRKTTTKIEKGSG